MSQSRSWSRRPRLMRMGRPGANPPNRALAIEKLLTPREAEIERFVAAGLSNKQIARKASIAEGTVKIHLHRAYQKLGIANRAGLAVSCSAQTLARGINDGDEA